MFPTGVVEDRGEHHHESDRKLVSPIGGSLGKSFVAPCNDVEHYGAPRDGRASYGQQKAERDTGQRKILASIPEAHTNEGQGEKERESVNPKGCGLAERASGSHCGIKH